MLARKRIAHEPVSSMSGRYRLVFNPFMLSMFVLFFSVFSVLSIWQVNRVFEKQALASLIEFANREAPVGLAGKSDDFLLEHLYFRATGAGTFLTDQCFFVENVIKKGKPGLFVYCPLRLKSNNRLLLVNMGWTGLTKERLTLPEFNVSPQPTRIEGVIKMPRSKPVVGTSSGRPNLELHNLWAYFDFDYLQAQFDEQFYPIELQMTSDIGTPMLREWSGFESKIGMHIGYAIHWAAFALVTLGLFLKFNLKKTDGND